MPLTRAAMKQLSYEVKWEDESEEELRTIPRQAPSLATMADRSGFIVRLKTTECNYRLNLPTNAKWFIGKENYEVRIQIGYEGPWWTVQCEYHDIRNKSHGMLRLTKGWGDLVEFIGLGQGDTLVFKACLELGNRYHLLVDKHPAAKMLEPGLYV